MPKTGTIIGYEFDELDDDAKDRVRYWLNDDADISMMTEDITEYLDWKHGVTANDIAWALDNGPDIAWKGYENDSCTIKKIVANAFDDRVARRIFAHIDYGFLEVDVRFSIRYVGGGDFRQSIDTGMHWTSTAYSDLTDLIPFRDMALKIERAVENHYNDVAADCLRVLREMHEYNMSDERVSDMCEANEYIFDKKGNPIHHKANFDTE